MSTIVVTLAQIAQCQIGALPAFTPEQSAQVKAENPPATPPTGTPTGSPPRNIDGHNVRVVPVVLNGGKVSLGEIGTDIIAVKVPDAGKFKVSFSQDGSAGSSFAAYAIVTDWANVRWTKVTATPIDLHSPPAGAYCIFRWDSRNMKPANTQAQVRIQSES